MAYTVSQFITQAQGGGAVKITKAAGNNKVVIKIGSQAIELVDDRLTHTLDNGIKTDVHTASRVLDLGTLFSAEDVLTSAPLRQAIIDGTVVAEAGTTALSMVPVSA